MRHHRTVDPAPAPSDRRRIAVVIPAYRVATLIEGVLREIPEYVSDVIVVDDDSPDDTSVVVARCGDPRVRVIHHERNEGVGGATITGYRCAREAGADVIVKLDGDGQMDPSQIGKLVAPILAGEVDYTKGNRFIHLRALRQMPLWRRIGNLGLSFMTKASSGYWDVFDPTNGYTAIEGRLVDEIDWENVDRRWFFETSMLIELGLMRAVVRDVYIPARYGNERSSLSARSALVRFPVRLFLGFLRRLWLRYFVMDFSAIALFVVTGLAFVVFGMVWAGYHWIRSAQTGAEASTGTVMIAVLPVILGAQLLLQAIVLDIQNEPRVPLSSKSRS